MEHETTLEYTMSLVREAVGGFWRRSVGARMWIALGLCAAGLVLSLVEGDRSWFVGFLATALFFGVASLLTLYVAHYRNATRKLRDMGAPRAVFRATEDSFTVSSGAGTATVPWFLVTEVWKFDRCWLLMLSKTQFMTLPLASVSEEMRRFILQRVAAAGGKVDDV